MASPGRPRVGKVRSRSGLLRKGEKKKTPVEVSSDNAEKDAVVQNLKGKLEGSGGNLEEVLVLKDLIEELLAAKSVARSSSGGIGMSMKGNEKQGEPEKGEKAKDVAEKNEEPDLAMGKETGKEDLASGLYFKDRVVYYCAMHYTEIQPLCKKKDIPYKKKDGGVWELARLNFEVLQKLEDQKEESNTTDNETSEDSSEHESNSESEKDSGQNDIAGI
ncbi:hypothetical protein CBR_g8778 [Chara braunii]|uniref:Uncharacterized protein n=1 Tax=Chara braunii TaxID=69332 RepID=A0A388KMS4_CHABU|nr:hypothetical protein CBR_g8778 [Chara braunii]|eukprot:GBG71359.1 hypothetical protein CBR_g8778 [Chara braunii]